MATNRLTAMFSKIDKLNACDPNTSFVDGQMVPNELLYGQRMSTMLNIFNPDSSEILQIAVRAQHIERWILARNNFAEGRSGYKKWRSQLALHHATKTAELMHQQNYDNEEIERIKYLLLKRGLKHDQETQCLEDVACLVFLAHYFREFAAKHSEEKIVNILRLTWEKMSEKGHKAALKLDLGANEAALIQSALS